MILTFFFFNDSATTEIYTLSLHDALPIYRRGRRARRRLPRRAPGRRAPERPIAGGVRGDRSWRGGSVLGRGEGLRRGARDEGDRKSTRLNSSHANISYAVFCLKKKNDMEK